MCIVSLVHIIQLLVLVGVILASVHCQFDCLDQQYQSDETEDMLLKLRYILLLLLMLCK